MFLLQSLGIEGVLALRGGVRMYLLNSELFSGVSSPCGLIPERLRDSLRQKVGQMKMMKKKKIEIEQHVGRRFLHESSTNSHLCSYHKSKQTSHLISVFYTGQLLRSFMIY